MAISVGSALQDYRYVYFGFQSQPTSTNPWQATPTMAVSNNLVQWETVSKFKELEGLRDGFVKKIDNYYYIIGTDKFYKTTDFIEFEPLLFLNTSKYKNLWAPEIFQDMNGKCHIVYCAGDASKGILDVYLADFDPKTDTISNEDQEVSFVDGAIDNSYKIDPDICLIDGVYFLTIGGNYVLSSNSYLGPYQRFPTNFAATPQKFGATDSGISGWVEGPNMFVDGNSVRLFADQTEGNGLVFRSAVVGDMFDWSNTEKTHAHFKMRHGSILVNDKVSARVPDEIDDSPKFDERISIQGLHAKEAVPLTCFLKNSMQYQYEDNQTNQLQFVAYNDGSPSFAYIANESTISFNNDLFIIKNVEEDTSGADLYTVTAIQYVNSEIGRVMQRNIRSGVLTYAMEDVLNFYLNDKVANPFGFSYRVYGNFDKQQIENLGGSTGKDMVSKITETWPGTIIYPQGKTINVFSPEAFRKNHGRRIVYEYNSSDMKLIEDSTGIINQVRCIGATVETDNDTSTDAGASEQLSESTKTIISGQDNTAAFQADAKKYLGVPYVWGGAGGTRGGNPFSGMDCSSYVSQVYKDFGITVPAQTVAMEPSFHEIPYEQVKPGDVGFYGPHGGTHHICLMLDHNTMIYEPQPGEVCKTAPVNSYRPSWFARNDAMQAKINTKKVEQVPVATISFHDDYSSSSTSSNDTSQQYYFQPFILQDDESIKRWGLHPGPDVQDDRFKDSQSMRNYAQKQLVTDPVISVEVTMHDNMVPIPGEQAYLTIPEKGTLVGNSGSTTQDAYNTTVTAVGFTWYPFDPSQGTDITFDNLQASILHAQTAYNAKSIEQLVNAALDRIPQIFYSREDPSANQSIKTGAIWAKPIQRQEEGGEIDDGSGQSHGTSNTGSQSARQAT